MRSALVRARGVATGRRRPPPRAPSGWGGGALGAAGLAMTRGRAGAVGSVVGLGGGVVAVPLLRMAAPLTSRARAPPCCPSCVMR